MTLYVRLLLIIVLVLLFSKFFNNRLVSDSGAGAEVLEGTIVRMPSTPDYDSFQRIVRDVSTPFRLLNISAISTTDDG
jgi:hypothetical protein